MIMKGVVQDPKERRARAALLGELSAVLPTTAVGGLILGIR